MLEGGVPKACIHLVICLQTVIACSMPDTVLGAESMNKGGKVGRTAAIPSGCCPFTFPLEVCFKVISFINKPISWSKVLLW